jgi:DNA-binding MarR family transcriptional regulator
MPDRAAALLLRDVVDACDALLSASATHAGLSRTERRALDVVIRCPGITAGDLAARLVVTTGAVTGVIDRLEGGGFVERRSSPRDRRIRVIQPTAKGCALDRLTWERVAAELGQATAGYPADDIGVVVGFLRDASAAVRRAREGVG